MVRGAAAGVRAPRRPNFERDTPPKLCLEKSRGRWWSHGTGAGLSHVLEHMLFKGTEKRGVAQIVFLRQHR